MQMIKKQKPAFIVYHLANEMLLISMIFFIVMISQVSVAKEINNHYSFNSNEGLLNSFYAKGSSNSNSINSTKHISPLSYQDRIMCQKATEEVYWNYRIWPKENKRSKPPFEQSMNYDILKAKVEDILKKTNALEINWNKIITGEQLQAEMVRMARHTKKPEILKDLWKALDNDPHLIAECLARPYLVEKNIRDSYSYDERIHGELKQRAQADLAKFPIADQMKQMSGSYLEVEWTREPGHKGSKGQEDKRTMGKGEIQSIKMNKEEWEKAIAKLIQDFNNISPERSDSNELTTYHLQAASSHLQHATLDEVSVGKLSPLKEDENRFYAVAVLYKDPNRIRIAIMAWEKQSFDSWWEKIKTKFNSSIDEISYSYKLPTIFQGPCGLDTWMATTTLNAPVGRGYQTAIWTGTEMIIWGGMINMSGYLYITDTGGRYNPITDSWIATSTINAPEAGFYHTAIWTGIEMIIWGGDNNIWGPPYLNTGGRYNPAMDA